MSPAKRETAVLLMSFGGPSSLEAVEDFLRRFLGARLPPQERIAEIKQKYALIGGGSPLAEITARQAEALEKELTRRGHGYPVYAGMRFSEPSVADSVARAVDQGIQRLAALPLTPHRSKLSTGPYSIALDEAIRAAGADLNVVEITGWHTHPLFIEAVEEKILEGFSHFSVDARPAVHLIFSAHSLPERAVFDDPYVDDIHGTITAIVDRSGPLNWHLAFQSRGGGAERWLEPDVEEVLKDLARAGTSRCLVVPIGFVSDHLETLYDLDVKYQKLADDLGVEYVRSPSLNDSSRFIQALASVVLESLDSSRDSGAP